MYKKSRFRWPIDKQHAKRAQTLLKSAAHHLDHICWSLLRQFSWRKPLSLRWQILGLLDNILAANDKYSVLNSYKLIIPIKMQLYQKQKTFSQFFSAFLISTWNFQQFEKKSDPHRFCISEMTDSAKVVR